MLRAEAPEMSQCLDFLNAARAAAQALGAPGVALYDPVPMRLSRLKNLDRAQFLVESARRPALQSFLGAWVGRLYALKAPRELRWHVDVDPFEF
jgi:primosomal protein N' (replication factor Y)